MQVGKNEGKGIPRNPVKESAKPIHTCTSTPLDLTLFAPPSDQNTADHRIGCIRVIKCRMHPMIPFCRASNFCKNGHIFIKYALFEAVTYYLLSFKILERLDVFWVQGSLFNTRYFTDFAENFAHWWMVHVSLAFCRYLEFLIWFSKFRCIIWWWMTTYKWHAMVRLSFPATSDAVHDSQAQ